MKTTSALGLWIRLHVEELEPRWVPSGCYNAAGLGTPATAAPTFAHVEVDVALGAFTPAEIAALEFVRVDTVSPAPAAAATPADIVPLDGGHQSNTLTIVLDFKEAGQPNTSDPFGNVVGAFDVSAYGFTADQYQSVIDAIAAEVDDNYFGELAGTAAGPSGQDLAIDFVIGDIGVAPSSGATTYYYVQIGSGISGTHGGNAGIFGVAGGSFVRTAAGQSGGRPNGSVVGSVFTNHINALAGINPTNALTSGNLFFTTQVLSSTIAHEIGHTLSLSHINKAGSTQAVAGTSPIMGTGALDLPNQDRLSERSFSLSGFDGQANNAARQHVQQLATAVKLHATGSAPPGEDKVHYLSTTAGGTLSSTNGSPSVSFADADILKLTVQANGQYQHQLHFDGSDVGLSSSSEDIDAFAFLADGSILISTTGSFSVPATGGGTLSGNDEDLLRFTPTSLGATTAGAWSLYFDGSDVGLTATSENIDAIAVLADGRLLLSTTGAFSAGGVSGQDEDLFAFTPTTLGATTTGTWALYFDGSDVGLGSNDSEDVNAVFVRETSGLPTLILSTAGTFSALGVSGANEDAVAFAPTSLGSATAGAFGPGLAFDGSLFGLGSFDVDGIRLA